MKMNLSRETISRIAIGVVFTIVVACIATKTYSNAQILKELKKEIGDTVQASTESYLEEYVVESGLIPNDTVGAMATEISSGVTKVLTNKNFTEDDVNKIDASVEDVMSKYIDNLNISDEEKKMLKQNIMALVMSSVLQSMLDKTYVTQEMLKLVQDNFDSKISDIETSIEEQKKNIDVSVSKVERLVSQAENKTANIAEIDQINAKLETLKTGNADKATIDGIIADIKKLQDKETTQDSSLTSLNNSLSQLSLSVNKTDNGQSVVTDRLKSQIDEVQSSLQTKIEKNVSDLASIKTEMENEISALNRSISSDVTSQIEALQTGLSNTTTTLNNRVATAEGRIDTAMTDMQSKLDQGQSKLDTLTNNYNQYMSDISGLQSTALQTIRNEVGTKTTSGARYDIEQDRVSSLNDIDSSKTDALGNISTSKTDALGAISGGKTSALSDIETARQGAVAELNDGFETKYGSLSNKIDQVSDDLDTKGYVYIWKHEEDGIEIVEINGGIPKPTPAP